MKPPKVVYVGPFDVDVKLTNVIADDCAGEFIEDATLAKIKPGLSRGMERDTVMHELLHAIVYLAGMRRTLGLDNAAEERLVVAMSPWILALLRDNPKLVEFLMENREREY